MNAKHEQQSEDVKSGGKITVNLMGKGTTKMLVTSSYELALI